MAPRRRVLLVVVVVVVVKGRRVLGAVGNVVGWVFGATWEERRQGMAGGRGGRMQVPRATRTQQGRLTGPLPLTPPVLRACWSALGFLVCTRQVSLSSLSLSLSPSLSSLSLSLSPLSLSLSHTHLILRARGRGRERGACRDEAAPLW